MVGVGKSFDDQKRNQDSHPRLKNKELIEIMESMPLKFFCTDRKFRVKDANKKACQWVSLSYQQVLNKSLLEFLPDEFLKRYKSDLIAFNNDHKRVYLSQEEIKSDLLNLNEYNFWMVKGTGEIYFFYQKLPVINTDSTAIDSIRILKAFLDSAIDSAVLLDLKGNVLLCNKVAAKRLKMDVEELLSKSIYDMFPPEIREFRRDKIEHVIRTGIPSRFTDKRDEHIFDNNIYPIKISPNNVVQIAIFAKEITDEYTQRKKQQTMQRQLLKLQKNETLGVLAGNIAHDFNNILMPIIGYIELVLSKSNFDAKSKVYLENVLQAARRAKDLVKQIKSFSQQSTQKRKPVYLNELVVEVSNLLRAAVPAHIKIHHSIDPECKPVLANLSEMHQVIMNLTTNAIQAIGTNSGQIDIALELCIPNKALQRKFPNLHSREYVKLTVTDNGPGIDEKDLEKIFEPFFSTRFESGGSGLGLSVVQKIVTGHEGEIIVNSRLEGGSNFSVYIPVTIKEHKATIREIESEWKGDENIFLVDDEPVIAELIKELLYPLGYQVDYFTDPVNALKAFGVQSSQYDIVVTDLVMPEMNGLQLTHAIKLIKPEIPVIMMTGFSAQLSDENYWKYGVDALVMKPLVQEEICRAIKRVQKK